MSEKPAAEAPTIVQSAVAAVTRLIPGADLAKPKPKKKKNKTNQAGSGAITPATAQVTTAESTPTAKVAEAPSTEDLPSDLVADKKEIEQELKDDADKEKSQGVKAKSPAEELVNKRIKLISKKIQRMAAYKDKEASALNPDQTAALKTLPGLEGAQKELEDILKGLENIERDAHSKRQEQDESHAKAVQAGKTEAMASYKETTLPLIASLISIHASLHPQDSNSSFIPPQLPAHLQDVSIEDVRTIDGLYEKLKEGESIDDVVREIKDKEGSSAYYLITGQTDPNAASAPAEEAQASPAASEPEDFSAEAAGEAAGLTAPIPDQLAPGPTASQSMSAFEQEPEVADAPPRGIEEPQAAAASSSMSFLQSSELEEPIKPSVGEIKDVEPENQISGPTLGLAGPEPAETSPEIPSTDSGVFGQPAGVIDWADDDEHTSQADIDALRKQFGMPVEAIPEDVALAPSMPVIDPSARPVGLPPIPAHARGGGGRGRGHIGGSAGQSGNWRKASGQGQDGSESQSQPFQPQQQSQQPREPRQNGFGRGRGGPPPHGHSHQQGPPAEDDGFQNVSRRRGGPPPGGFPGGGFRGAHEGGPGGRGRGGPGRGGRGQGPFRGGRGGGPSGGEGRPPQAPRQPSQPSQPSTAPA